MAMPRRTALSKLFDAGQSTGVLVHDEVQGTGAALAAPPGKARRPPKTKVEASRTARSRCRDMVLPFDPRGSSPKAGRIMTDANHVSQAKRSSMASGAGALVGALLHKA